MLSAHGGSEHGLIKFYVTIRFLRYFHYLGSNLSFIISDLLTIYVCYSQLTKQEPDFRISLIHLVTMSWSLGYGSLCAIRSRKENKIEIGELKSHILENT